MLQSNTGLVAGIVVAVLLLVTVVTGISLLYRRFVLLHCYLITMGYTVYVIMVYHETIDILQGSLECRKMLTCNFFTKDSNILFCCIQGLECTPPLVYRKIPSIVASSRSSFKNFVNQTLSCSSDEIKPIDIAFFYFTSPSNTFYSY